MNTQPFYFFGAGVLAALFFISTPQVHALGESVCVGGPHASPQVNLFWEAMDVDSPAESFSNWSEATFYSVNRTPGPSPVIWESFPSRIGTPSGLSFTDIAVTPDTSYGYSIYPEEAYHLEPYEGVVEVSSCESALVINVEDTPNGSGTWKMVSGGYVVAQNPTTLISTYPDTEGTTYSLLVTPPVGYEATISNSDGGASSVLVFPQQAKSFTITYTETDPTPTLSLNSAKASVVNGGSTVLSWSTTNVNNCTASSAPDTGVWNSAKPVNGSQSTGPMSQTTIFSLTCNGLEESVQQEVTVLVVSAPPPPPQNVSADTSSMCGGEILLTWSASAGATEYKVYKNEELTAVVSGTSFLDTGLDPENPYGYVVYASNAFGTSAESDVAVAFPSSECAEGPIVELIANPSFINSEGDVVLSWEISNAVSCQAFLTSPSYTSWWGSRPAEDGSETILVKENQNFFLVCFDAEGRIAGDSAFVTVDNPSCTSPQITSPTSQNANVGSPFSYVLGYNTEATEPVTKNMISGSLPPGLSFDAGVISGTPTDSGSFEAGLKVLNECGYDTENVSINVFEEGGGPLQYSLTNLTGNVSVTKGAAPTLTQIQVGKTFISGELSPVTITAENVPTGVSVSYGNRTCSPSCESTVIFTVDHTAPAGEHIITIQGAGEGAFQQSFSFSLTIEEPSGMQVSCVASPMVAFVGQQVTWTASVVGGEPPYTYEWSGTEISAESPPTSNPYLHTYSLVGAKTASVVVNDDVGEQATCSVQVLQVNVDPNYTEI